MAEARRLTRKSEAILFDGASVPLAEQRAKPWQHGDGAKKIPDPKGYLRCEPPRIKL